LDAVINPDMRSALPNTESRTGPRSEAARRACATLRDSLGATALLLTTSGSVNWRTGGLSDPVDLTATSDPVWVLDVGERRALITSEVEAPRLEGDLRTRDLGWDVLVAPWYDLNASVLLAAEYADVSPETLLSDTDAVGRNVRDRVVMARLVLSDGEQEELRELGSLVGKALGEGVDSWQPGVSTDREVAAVISQLLVSQGATPVCLIVGGDERLRRYRHPLAVGAVVSDALMAVVVAKRAGLHVAATRICLRRSDDDIVTLLKTLDHVNDAVLRASLPGGTWGETIAAIANGYAAIGQPDAWREHFQGGPIGFEQREFELAPVQVASPFWEVARRANTAIAWNPSLRGGAKIEETYLVGDGLELLTATPSWPTAENSFGVRRSLAKVAA
jgi:Xaa-Pro dipeptidase